MNNELQTAVENLGLEKFRRHIFLCVDPDEPNCCPRETSLAAWAFLKTRLKELNRSEEHTSELQSLRHLVCRLLLEKITHPNPTPPQPKKGGDHRGRHFFPTRRSSDLCPRETSLAAWAFLKTRLKELN